MTDEQLIAQQAKRIAELEEELALRNESEREIRMEIYGIGGPLNDNKLGYTKVQMLPFERIAHQLGKHSNHGYAPSGTHKDPAR